MKIKELIEKIKNNPDCVVFRSKGVPNCGENCVLPEDLKEFYELCGGVILYSSKDYAMEIVNPEKFQLANPIIVGELCPYDISSQWYIIACNMNGDYLTIDLSSERNGRCYDSFWDRHGVVGECPIIANSFTDLLCCLLNSNGEYLYWLDDSFVSLGDAYDE